MTDERPTSSDTRGVDYARRLQNLEQVWWKRLLDVQRPYRRNLAKQDLGRTLDVGAGLGRNLINLPPGSVGVDHNAHSVSIGRSRGLDLVTVDEFPAKAAESGLFDAILLSHVLEHMDEDAADEILRSYLPHLRPGGKIMMICPQERGYATDATHVRFVDLDGLRAHATRHGLTVASARSFPFPRPVGRVFPYHEFIVIATKA